MTNEELQSFLGSADMTVVDAMEKIDANSCGILFITDKDRRLLGALTDGNVRRWLIRTGSLKALVSEAMNPTPKYLRADQIAMAQKLMAEFHVTCLPVVSSGNRIIDLIFNTKRPAGPGIPNTDALADVPIVIMAGGKGTRLYPYTKILPKPLIPIGDIPISEHIINRFRRFGCRDFRLVVNYQKNMIKAYYNEIDKDYNITYIDEDVPLGTGGGLSLLKGQIPSTFILSNCDILINDDFVRIFRYHKERGNQITMICSLKNYRIPYGVVHMSEGGAIESMEEKPTVSFFTNTGCYIVEPEVLDSIPTNTEVGFPEVIENLRRDGAKVGVYPISETAWMDMGQMDGLEEMREKLVQ